MADETSAPDTDTPADLHREGIALFLAGDDAAAEKLLREAVEADPSLDASGWASFYPNAETNE